MDPRRRARLLGAGVAFAGAVNVVSAVTPGLRTRVASIEHLLTPEAAGIAAGAAALIGIVLLLLGRGIAHRRIMAYRATAALLILSTVAHVIKGVDVEEAVLTSLLAGVLIWNRRVFIVGHEPTRWRTVARAIPLIVAIDLAYGIGTILVRHGLVTPSPTIGSAFHETVARLIGFTGPLSVGGHLGRWFPTSLTILGAASLGGVILLLLAPIAERTATARDASHDRDAIRALIARPDGDTLDFFALRSDKAYVFSGDGRAAVACRYVGGVGLASGDPVGDPEAFDDAIARFVERCDRSGWRPAVLGAREDRVPRWEAAGLRPFYLGDEAIVDVGTFAMVGRAFRNLRQTVSHARGVGVTTEIVAEGDLDPTLRRALIGIADRHRAGAPERGFSMALGDLERGEPACTIVVARDASGGPVAFQRYVPCRDGKGLSLDAMRRDPDAPNGVNETMIVDVIAWARARGVDEVSLNFAAFRGLIERGARLSRMQAFQAVLVRRVSPYFQIDSLRRFNAKFHPRWVPRYLMYRRAGDLAAVGIASLNAERFLVLPGFLRRGEPAAPSPDTGVRSA